MKLEDWIGRSESSDDLVTAAPCAALAAVLDRDPSRPPAGTPLPPLWHWLYFLPLHRQSEIGPDGHPQRGGFLPPVTLPRRMWAGSRLAFNRALHIGDEVRRRSSIESVSEKNGRSGPLTFITLRHEISVNGDTQPAIIEHQDLVYREAPVAGATPAGRPAAPLKAEWKKSWRADEVLLFRYSALTFNGHRIHYDRRYATEVEGYPGLVVHGPLLATLLLDLVRQERPQATVRRFEFRAASPIFEGEPFFVCGEPGTDGNVRLWAQDAEGTLAMDASAVLE